MDRELEIYLGELKKEKIKNSFNFWAKQLDILLQMYNLAIHVLSIPATSAPVERIFSKAKYILSRQRHNLKDKNLESELLFKVNFDFLD